MAMQPYSGRNAPRLKRNSPTFTRRPDVPRGFPLVGNGLGGFPKRKTEVPDAWTLTVDITAGGQTWTVDINAGTGIEIVVDWGDGLIEPFSTTGQKDHTYNAPGRYYPRISGKFASDGNIRLGSNSGNRAWLKATSVIPFIPGLVSFQSTFNSCTGLTSIPTDLFRYNTLVSTLGFDSTFYGCTGLTGSIPTDLFKYNTLVSSNGFSNTFRNCSGLTGSIPTDLFRYNTLVSTLGFNETFRNCSGLTGSIHADLFRYNTLVSSNGFTATFQGCIGLTGSIPTDLFRYNTLVSSNGFYQTFRDCTGLTGSIPTDLFRYNTAVSTNGFTATFQGCIGLTGSIPTDLFRYNTAVSTKGFYGTFYGCSGLTGSIPTDLFRYNTLVSTDGFYQTFYGCTGLTSLPPLLFKYNTACTSFFETFRNCNKLQLRADMFFDTGEEGTRFLNQTVNFAGAMRIGTFTGTQGTAPALWTCDFGTGTPTKTNCFTGHTTSSVDNHAAIVADGTWGLP